MGAAKNLIEAWKTLGKSGLKAASKTAARWGLGGAKSLKASDRQWIEWLKTNDKAGRFVNMGKDTIGRQMWKDTVTNAKVSSKGAAKALYGSGVKGGFTPTVKQAALNTAKVSKDAWNVAKPHVKEGAKTAVKVVEKGAGWAKGVGDFVLKHPIASFIAGTIAYKKTGHDDGFVNFLGRLIGGDDYQHKGALKVAGESLFGVRTTTDGKKVDTPLTEMILDDVFGYGTYDSIVSMGSNAGNQMVAKLEAMKEKGGEAGEWAKEQLANFYNGGTQSSQPTYDYEGNMMVKDTGTGRYVDNTTQQYPSFGSQAAGGVMNSLNNAANYVSGQNVNKMDIASLLMSAFLFSRAGLMAKVGSAVLGGVTMHNINKRAASPAQAVPSQSYAQSVSRQTESQPLYDPQQEENGEENKARWGLGK